ncbi:hypothetical protein K470DRAFT_263304 [Piedraia hortae CBS 480.64]|uniref:Uncharacterized protein n=1 Tax=Piedraia hortae CBS 480.64 TaxID=1314780 RepID=A0A6A7C349_9PEZI|nr:hypothetical protein K470DRAFT_263304 [Piedraia hortae CBS 480.64]
MVTHTVDRKSLVGNHYTFSVTNTLRSISRPGSLPYLSSFHTLHCQFLTSFFRKQESHLLSLFSTQEKSSSQLLPSEMSSVRKYSANIKQAAQAVHGTYEPTSRASQAPASVEVEDADAMEAGNGAAHKYETDSIGADLDALSDLISPVSFRPA